MRSRNGFLVAFAVLVLGLLPAAAGGKTPEQSPVQKQFRPPAPPAVINPAIPPDPFTVSASVPNWEGVSNGQGYRMVKVLVRIRASARPEKVRVGWTQDLAGRPWESWTAPEVETGLEVMVPRGTGARMIYLEALGTGGASAKAAAPFEIPARKAFRIQYPAEAKEYSQSRGFKFDPKKLDATSRCEIWKGSAGRHRQTRGTAITPAIPRGPTGSRCDFTLFDGRRLNAGWVFRTYSAGAVCDPPGRNYTVNERPAANGNLARFKVHLWSDPMKECTWNLSDMTLEGPGDGHWKDAFE